MNKEFKNKNCYGSYRLLLFILLAACSTVVAQISVPGTGRTGVKQTDPNWFVYGKWNKVYEEEDPLVYTAPVRMVVSSGENFCIQTNDHRDSAYAVPLHSGGADVYFSYSFYVIQDGTYSTNDFYVDGKNATPLVELVRYTNQYDREVIASDQTDHSSCVPYSFTQYLTAGIYEIRIQDRIAGVANPAYMLVKSTGGNVGKCVPPVLMNSSDHYTINSGATLNIPLSSTVSSTFAWHTDGNVNTSLSTSESGTTSSIVKTITNLTSTAQTITYTVQPTSTSGSCKGLKQTITVTINPACINGCDAITCADCIGSFAPEPGTTYVVSAWVQQSNSAQEMTYTGPALSLNFTGGGSQGPFYAKGAIIDGWQRIDTTFTVPNGASEVFVKLVNTGDNEVYFDDLRIHPLNSSLKSFVYDPLSMRLMAELDENNYATFYEYDEEGALIRVKKETERGIKTIKETGNNTRKQP